MNSTTTNLKAQFSVFTTEQLQALRISLWKYVVDCETDNRTNSSVYKQAVEMFEYLDFRLNF